ncbi:MAG: aminotransferase class III-fold pyridoxal phosphate-dependent enzyme [Paracoccaceae bacterium]
MSSRGPTRCSCTDDLFRHPAVAAAGLANIEILEREKIPERVRTTGAIFETALRGLSDMAMVGEVRGSHFMIGIEFVKNKATREEFAPDAMIGLLVSRECRSAA